MSGERPPIRGRGTAENPENRYERVHLEPDPPGDADAASVGPETQVFRDTSRTILAENASPDVGFRWSLNPYRGCEHGCTYCFARPTHSFLGLSPGLDFETKIVAKPEAVRLLRRELARPEYRCAPIALGSNTDPYQPVEGRLRITRGILELLRECRHPVTIVTKSARVLRDLDLLEPMAEDGLAEVAISITTLDPALARRMEPRAAAPARRLETLRALSERSVPTAVFVSPLIPGLNDSELERILEEGAGAGARAASFALLRLPHEMRRLFPEWLRASLPSRAEKILALLRDTRGGDLYDARFGARVRGTGPVAALLRRRFEVACRRLRLAKGSGGLDTTRFVPPRDGKTPRSLFE